MAANHLSTAHKTIKALTPKFPYVFAWFKTMNHSKHEIAAELRAAYNEKVPVSAVYKKLDGTWMDARALSPMSLRTLNEELPAKLIPQLKAKEEV